MSDNNKEEIVKDIILKATALSRALVSIEQDPDLVSVFSIARAHGYRVTSQFWHKENNELAQALAKWVEDNKTKEEPPGLKLAD